MSAISASDPRDLWALMGGVALVVLALHGWSRYEDADPGRIESECTDGSVIGERLGRVRRRPGRTPGQRARLALRFPGWSGGRRLAEVREDLARGDLGAVRIREGREGESAWVVEGLDAGRARIAIRWEFATADDALAALRVVEARIVAAPAGAPEPASDAEFDSATERERLEGEA